MQLSGRPRVAILLPAADDWQSVVAHDIISDRHRLLERIVKELEGVDAVEASVIMDVEDAAIAANRSLTAGVEVTLIAATMAVLPAVALEALSRLADKPVVIWALTCGAPLSQDAAHDRIVLDGGTVGASMLSSLLVRIGRPYELVIGALGDADVCSRVERDLRSGAAASRLSRARLGRIGDPANGYDCVALDEERLHEAIGLSVIHVAPEEFVSLYSSVPNQVVADILEETRSEYAVHSSVVDEDLERACRAAAALEQLCEENQLDGGALTCHIPGVRFEPGLGFAPCFALGRLTSRGTPWACSCDLLAAVAMLALKALGAAAQYHELELLDPQAQEFLIASSGEHDLVLAAEGDACLVHNGWFPQDSHPSICACFTPRAGPATLLGFVQIDTPNPLHRFVVAHGAFGARHFESVGTPNAAFRFASGRAEDAWARWCQAGVALHSAATAGDFVSDLQTTGRFLGVDVCLV
jgi:L-arabinose isomerase